MVPMNKPPISMMDQLSIISKILMELPTKPPPIGKVMKPEKRPKKMPMVILSTTRYGLMNMVQPTRKKCSKMVLTT